MSSPDLIPISQFIRVNRRKTEPLYLQIAYQFINAVQRGLIPVGAKLPGTRVWSEILGVHRKTIIAAFDELEAQNWIRIQPKVGAFVQNPSLKISKNEKEDGGQRKSLSHADFTFYKSFVLTSPFEKEEHKFICNDGQPDYRIVKTQELTRFYNAALKRRNIQNNIGHFAVQENDFFKEQLSYYLNLTRGFHISKAHILTAKSQGLLLYTLAKLLIKENDLVLVGELSYYATNMAFNQEKAKIETVPIDENGLDVEYIQQHYQKGDIRCVYLNPQHHYPTTVTFSKERRKALIQLAEEYDFVIIEDSDDFDFSYHKEVALPMATGRTHNRVIFLGAIGKYLHPTFQLNFMVAPIDFIAEAKKHVALLNPQGNFVLEQALGEMIVEGDLFRYHRKALKVYKERRVKFGKLLQAKFGKSIHVVPPENGLAYWIVFNKKIALTKLAENLKKRDVFLPRICMYQNKNQVALRLGFAHWTHEEAEEVLSVLKEELDEL